ncbi:hypothetical protein GGH95_001144 [Coemansia sp. RSA 1836]|nr:hypothetical protein IWW47_000846 [Coemansia sp. RSA 2052]KAJ2583169.1 hypothetical protein GGH95_001144 [Coemansia sp. RSA 1836]
MSHSISAGGLEIDHRDPFEVIDYDPAWADMFSNERDLIANTIGEYTMDIEHVGSTSIPGLAAKPIIDIQVVVEDFSNLTQCVKAMQNIGYRYKGTTGIEGREYFKRPLFHVHMVQVGNDEYTRKRLFLAYLRTHDDVRQEYAELKRRLVAKWAGYPNAHLEYNSDKTEFIMGVLARAGYESK